MITEREWRSQMQEANDCVNSLYWNRPGFNVTLLQESREVLSDFDNTMKQLLTAERSIFSFAKRKRIEREIQELNNIFQSFRCSLQVA